MDAGAVSSLAVGIDGAAMPDRFQRLDGAQNHFAPWLAVDGGDEADATGIVLLVRRIGVRIFETPGIRDEALDLGVDPPPLAGEVRSKAGEGESSRGSLPLSRCARHLPRNRGKIMATRSYRS